MPAPARRLLRAPDAPSAGTSAKHAELRADDGRHLVAACACGVHAALRTPAARPAGTRKPEAVRYDVTIAQATSGYIGVDAHFPTGGKATIDLAMPRWTPGSYKMRNYAKSIDDDVRAFDEHGAPLAITKTDVSSWRVETGGAKDVTVRYKTYAHGDLSVVANWLDDKLGLINGAATFMTLANDPFERPHEVSITAPEFPEGPISALPTAKGDSTRFIAPSFDKLVDSPIALGATDRRDIVVDGVTYVLATQGAGGVFDTAKAAADLRGMLVEMHRLWGKPPFERYVFLNLLTESGGGLEHLDSTTLMASRWSTRTRDAYVRWLGLATHELFHAWNVKRLRPAELGPFDYQRENITSSLWVAEGITSYYEKLLVRRSGLSTVSEMLGALSQAIGALQGEPGRTVQTLCASSRDAWVKSYVPDENSPNVEISYYTKGGLVAFLLDAEIRKRTNSTKSLDDVMRLAYARYSGDVGYTPEQFEAVISEVAGADMKPWLDRAIRSTEELPFDEGLAALGLRFKEAPPQLTSAYLGVQTNLAFITRIVPNTPAARAGLMVGDEIVGIGGYRVPPGELTNRLGKYQGGEASTILISRRDRLETLPITFGMPKRQSFEIELDPNATPEAKARRAAWLGA